MPDDQGPPAELLKSPRLDHVFGDGSLIYADVVNAVLPIALREHYFFEDNEKFAMRRDAAAVNQRFWLEILGRAHQAAVVSLLRSAGWINGMVQAVEMDNIFSFTACARSLMESTGDTLWSLRDIPLNLARNCGDIRRYIKGKHDSSIIGGPEYEERLIHFTYARKLYKGETAPAEHRAETAARYIAALEIEGADRLYELFCQIVHPGFGSTLAMISSVETQDGATDFWVPDFSRKCINMTLESPVCSAVLPRVYSMSLNMGLLLLATLNVFGCFAPLPIHPDLMRAIPLWAEIRDALAQQGVLILPVRHVGRNEACPCGSGKKFKKCHGG